MNFSRVIKAMAILGLAGFGVAAQAINTGDTFEGYSVGVFKTQGPANWTAGGADVSEIASTYVSEFVDCVPQVSTAVSSKVLDLKTEGTNLTYTVNSTYKYDVAVNALVKLVGSDTAPVITDPTVQTAVYWNTVTGNICAYVETNALNGASGWLALTGVTPSTNWACLKIEVDYVTDPAAPKARYTVNGTALNSGAWLTVANSQNAVTVKKVTDVTFRGTGQVDNFTVGQTERTYNVAKIITRSIGSSGGVIETDGPTGVNYTMPSTYSNEFDAEVGGSNVLDKVEILLADGVTVKKTLANPVVAEPISLAAEFVDGETYYVQATYKLKQFTVTTTIDYSDALANPTPVVVTKNYGEAYTQNFSSYFTAWESGSDNLFTTYENATVDFASVTQNITVTMIGTSPMYSVTVNIDYTDDTDPAPTIVSKLYGEGYSQSFAASFDIWASGSDTVGSTYLSPVVNLASVTQNISVTLVGTKNPPPPSDPIVITPASLAFTSIVYGATTVTVGFSASGTVSSSPATMDLIVDTDVAAGGTTKVAVSVTAAPVGTGAFTGSFTVLQSALPVSNTLFLKGLGTVAP